MPGLNCLLMRAGLIELAHHGYLSELERVALVAHLDVCPACARQFDEQVSLLVALRDLNECAPVPPPAELEAALLAEFDSMRRGRGRKALRWMPVAAALLAAAILSGWWLTRRAPEPPLPAPRIEAHSTPAIQSVVPAAAVHRRTRSVKRTTRRPAPEPAVPFVAIPYTIPLAPGERAQVFRMELPVAAVRSVGVPVQTADPGAQAEADVLVGEDGRPHAIRLLSISNFAR